ncbi:hypothetical protein [Phaeobacter sp. HF9A]|uniref:hypothetical protein n=1 Tax=Phaeobacter sp. HF9A TaxID=2721561 RepID=UPI001430A58E|nr:hypothetical protein [Phaeobacter sp. HF9A]NIZ12020.1 hypothetical protein [Phaeobacter sp. HF9A]
MQDRSSLSAGPQVSDAVARIWRVLGLPAPLEVIGDLYTFELEDTPVEIERTPDGMGLRLRAVIGQLGEDPHLCEQQLSRLLELSLGLAAFNRAVLVFPAGRDGARLQALSRPDHAPEPVSAEIAIRDAGEAVDALRDLMQWRSYAGDVITSSGARVEPALAPQSDASDPGEMVIFQP